jgi:hypothetical protein
MPRIAFLVLTLPGRVNRRSDEKNGMRPHVEDVPWHVAPSRAGHKRFSPETDLCLDLPVGLAVGGLTEALRRSTLRDTDVWRWIVQFGLGRAGFYSAGPHLLHIYADLPCQPDPHE